jgi:hypothetical protein
MGEPDAWTRDALGSKHVTYHLLGRFNEVYLGDKLLVVFTEHRDDVPLPDLLE